MAHDNHVLDGVNKDLIGDIRSREQYLELAGNWVDPLGDPVVVDHDGVKVVRDDMIVGSKARFADLLLSKVESDTICYVQPRFGLAGVSILDAAARHGKKVVLFMPAAKKISYHQACCIERGATAHFRKIPAMPNLNKMAQDWAEENGAAFVPLGLKHPLVTTCIVKVCETIREKHGDPKKLYYAMSTGVLGRGLQIGFPNTEHHAIAVARNMKSGEAGWATVYSHPKQFTAAVAKDKMPPYPTVPTYDAKVWEYVPKDEDGVWVWNVGKEPVLNDETIFDRIDSDRSWGEVR